MPVSRHCTCRTAERVVMTTAGRTQTIWALVQWAPPASETPPVSVWRRASGWGSGPVCGLCAASRWIGVLQAFRHPATGNAVLFVSCHPAVVSRVGDIQSSCRVGNAGYLLRKVPVAGGRSCLSRAEPPFTSLVLLWGCREG